MVQAIIFDFDGVILESGQVKTEAFKTLFSQFPDHCDEALAFHLASRGLSRHRQLEHIVNNVIKLSPAEGVVDRLARRFGEIVVSKMRVCPFVEGAVEFLDHWVGRLPLYVASLNPQEELDAIVQARGLAKYFHRVVGGTGDKAEILSTLVAECGLDPSRTLFIGDTLGDYRAAVEMEMRFVGRKIESRFAALGVPIFDTFGEIAEHILADHARSKAIQRKGGYDD